MLNQKQGFTLIELLIVVAIIAILAAIAIPNFLQAQTRAKVARVKAEFQTLTTALEAYAVDNNVYPFDWDEVDEYPYYLNKCITTPVSYISSGGGSGETGEGVLTDPFGIGRAVNGLALVSERYRYKDFQDDWTKGSPSPFSLPGPTAPGIIQGLNDLGSWWLESRGPDRYTDVPSTFGDGNNLGDWLWPVYDPTNGTISNGDVMRSQKQPDVDGSTYQ